MNYVELSDGTYINLAGIVGFRWCSGKLLIFDGTDNPMQIPDMLKANYNRLRVASCN